MRKRQKRTSDPAIRREELIIVGFKMAEEDSLTNVTRNLLASRSGCTASLMNYYFKNLANFHCEIMKHAVEKRALSVLAQGLSMRNEIALGINKALKRDVIKFLSKD